MSSQAEETDKPLFKWSEFSDAERRLLTEICYHTARIVWMDRGKGDRTYQTVMHHGFLSAYESACDLCARLGLFESINGIEFKCSMPLEEMRGYLLSKQIEMSESFEDLFSEFLSLAAGQASFVGGSKILSEERDPFVPPDSALELMWAFVELGYADRVADGFAWTDKITPYMQAAYLWDNKTGVPRATQFKADVAAFADELWFSMPVWRRHLMARSIVGKDGLEIYSFLLRKWENGRFRFLPKFPWYILPKSVRFKAMRLRDRIFGKRSRIPDELSPALTEIIRRLVIVRKSHPF